LGFALVVAAVVVGGGGATRWMSVRPLAWVGLVSYGVYMWHVPLLLFARSIGVFPHSYAVRLAVILGPVLLAAAASWYLVERPAIAWAARPRGSRRAGDREGRVAERDGRGRPAQRDGRTAQPDTRTAQPDTRAAQPATRTAHPDTRTAQAQLEAHAAP
jgi:peptidoglycan/LPS O-acetylase OafA/YrhL